MGRRKRYFNNSLSSFQKGIFIHLTQLRKYRYARRKHLKPPNVPPPRDEKSLHTPALLRGPEEGPRQPRLRVNTSSMAYSCAISGKQILLLRPYFPQLSNRENTECTGLLRGLTEIFIKHLIHSMNSMGSSD